MNKTEKNSLKALKEFSNNIKKQNNECGMFVYFDQNGNIKCISPIEEKDLEKSYLSTKIPLTQVRRFISGEANPNKFLVKPKKGKISQYVILEKVDEVNYVRKLDRFLTEVNENCILNKDIEIIADENSSTITFKLNKEIRDEFLESIDNIEKANISGLRNFSFYLTAKHNPDILIESIIVPVKDLLKNNEVYKATETSDYNKLSLFTRKIFKNYSYGIIQK